MKLPYHSYLTIVLAVTSYTCCSANDFSSILKTIEANSSRLENLRKQNIADKAINKTMNSLEGPALETGYLWGNHSIGNRIDLSASQQFEFPTVYIQRHKLIRQLNNNADTRYLSQRQQYLLKAKQLCIQILFCNALIHHLKKDKDDAQVVAASIKKQYDNGEATAIDYHKAEQSAVVFINEYKQYQAMRQSLLAELKQMNGNQDICVNDTLFLHTPLPSDFDTWLNSQVNAHPEYLLALGTLREKEQAFKVSKNQWLPHLNVGYASEKTREEHYQGVKIGISVPFWNARKRIKAHKQQVEAARLELDNTRQETITHLRNLYNEALNLQTTVANYTRTFSHYDNTPLLKKSLLYGQINIITYLQEIHWGHDMREQQLQAECELEMKIAELTATQL